MQKKFTFCLGALVAVAGFTGFAIERGANAPLKELGNEVYTVPVTFQPTQEQWENCFVADYNEDGTKWQMTYDGGDPCIKYGFNSSNAANDWCYLPQVSMDPGVYKITYSYRTITDPESFRICLGKDLVPENYTEVLMEKIEYTNTQWTTSSSIVDIEEEGIYRVGLYAFSEKFRYGIFFRNITITKVNYDAPMPATAVIEANGLEGVMNVTLPSKNAGGNDLSGEITASITLDNEELPFATISGNPGETIEVPVSVPNRGTHVFKILCSLEVNGEMVNSEVCEISHMFTRYIPVPLPLGYSIIPDDDDALYCTIIDSNEDTRTWTLYNYSLPEGFIAPKAFRYESSYSHEADDWLVLPQISATETGAAKLDFLLGTKNALEDLDIAVATTNDVEAFSQNIVASYEDFMTSDKFIRQEIFFSVPVGEPFYVAFHAKSPDTRGSIWLQDLAVFSADPAIPNAIEFTESNFDGGNGTVGILFPTQNISGEDITSALFAELSLDGAVYGDPVSGNAGEEKNVEFSNLTLGNHTLSAVTYILDDEGNRLNSKTVSTILEITPNENFCFYIPAEILPSEAIMSVCKVIDVNDDGSTWYYDQSLKCWAAKYSGTNTADDWFITPRIEVGDVDHAFNIEISAKCRSTGLPERMEVFIGDEQTAEAMTTCVIESTDISNADEYQIFSGQVTLPAAGNYYIGIHCISDPDMYYLYVNQINMKSLGSDVKVATAKVGEGKVFGMNGAIRLQGFDGQDVTVMDMAGRIVKQGKVSASSQTLIAAPGMYVVKAGSNSYKVVVK